MDNESEKAIDVARLTNYQINPLVSQIHQKTGTFHIVRDAAGVNAVDTSLNEIAGAPASDPTQELSESPKNFLGEIQVGVPGKR